jgi:hypothetical protein
VTFTDYPFGPPALCLDGAARRRVAAIVARLQPSPANRMREVLTAYYDTDARLVERAVVETLVELRRRAEHHKDREPVPLHANAGRAQWTV